MSISSRLNIDDESWSSCKYEFFVDINFSNGTSKTLEDIQISGAYLEKDYDNDHLPILMLDVILSKLDYEKIDDDTGFHIRINQFYLKNNDIKSEKKSMKIYIDDTFIRLDPNTSTNTNISTEKEIRKATQTSDDELSPSDLKNKYTFVLVKKSDLELTKKMTNAILIGVNQETVVKYLLSESKCPNKVLMASFDNKSNHNQLVLLPKTLLQQLIFLENEYGWYKEGGCIFIDYDTFYIVRKSGKCSVWKKNEIKSVCFCINDTSSEDNISASIIQQNNTTYINLGNTQFSLLEAGVIDDQLTGSNVVLFNTSTGESETIISNTKSLDGTGSYTTKSYHGHNPYIKNQYITRKQETEHSWELNCNNVDISLFTPNKQFSFLTDVTSLDKQMKGNYRISSIKVSFIKESNTFDNLATVIVKRTNS